MSERRQSVLVTDPAEISPHRRYRWRTGGGIAVRGWQRRHNSHRSADHP